MRIKELIESIGKDTKELNKLITEGINGYVDEGEIGYVGTDNSITFEVRGAVYYIYKYTNITQIKPSGCPKTLPKTKEEAMLMYDSMAIAHKCALQAYLMYKYLIS